MENHGAVTVVTLPQISTTLTGTTMTLSWPVAFSNYVLQSTTRLGDSWTPATEPVQIIDNKCQVSLPATNNSQFFRLNSAL